MSKICDYCGTIVPDSHQVPETCVTRSRVAQRCPVCNGCTTVPSDFYDRIGYGASVARVPCRACGGTGLVWG